MIKGVIFDLDLTLVDTSNMEPLRRKGNWQGVYKAIPASTIYEGVEELVAHCRSLGLKVGVATSSPSTYATKVLAHHRIKFDALVAYHDTDRKKPHPDPLLLAAEKLGIKPTHILAIGDDPKDVISAKAASMTAVAACWGSINVENLEEEDWDYSCANVAQLHRLISELQKDGSDA